MPDRNQAVIENKDTHTPNLGLKFSAKFTSHVSIAEIYFYEINKLNKSFNVQSQREKFLIHPLRTTVNLPSVRPYFRGLTFLNITM